MSTAENRAPARAAPLSWAQICTLHPSEWVCLLDIEHEPDGSIRSARIVSHDPSIERALDRIDPPDPDATVMHTAGRPWWTPRIEIVDENRDLVRARR
jgi:hypothetical protein